jgi:N-acetylmuramoyl-L-alanine amidase
VLTDPPYLIEDSTVGVHLRWYLANSVFRSAVKDGADEAKVVFLSIHADSLHPSLRGAMAYIPGARWRGGSYGKTGPIYAARREVREGPRVSFAAKQLLKSEGLSRSLAQHLLGAFRERDLVIHADKPIREKIIRSRRAWVPAVLRYNQVPAAMLVEVCNLANSDDRRLLETVEFREKVAEALVDGILRYYGDSQVPSSALRVAATAR